MKIKSIAIRNFRCLRDQTISCEDFNTFVGPNGSGKSTVLHALNLFFGDISSFSDDDFHRRDVSSPISIKVSFGSLSPEAQDEFKHYVRGGQLVVEASVAKNDSGGITRTLHGERLAFEKFRPFFEAKTAGERGATYKQLKGDFPDIADATNDENRKSAILSYEEGMPDDQKTLIKSGAEFFGISKGVHKFQRHLCWVYVPAVKDASSESEEGKSSHLGKLIQHTIRAQMNYDGDLAKIRSDAFAAYQTLLAGQKEHLTKLQSRLATRLQAAVTTKADLSLDWKSDEKSVSVSDPIAQVLLTDKGFSGEVEKFGHGLQRSFLLVILQELMAVDNEVTPTLILGCEEPELYQHPPQAKHLASLMMELSQGDAQVFITTHSPYFIDVQNYEGIRLFRNGGGEATINRSSFASIMASYNSAFSKPLNTEDQARTKLAIQTQPKFNEIFFADKVVLVEGICDAACFETYLRLSGKKAQFQRSGAAIAVCEGKSSLALMLLMLKDFRTPYHVVFDCDAHCEPQHAHEHIRDNDAIMKLAGHPAIGALPTAHIFHDNLSAWHHDIEGVLEDEYAADSQQFNQIGQNAVGQLKSSKKNPLYVAAAMKGAWDAGRRFPILEKVIDSILA